MGTPVASGSQPEPIRRALPPGLERSCGGDRLTLAPPGDGLPRLEGAFSGRAYGPHRHDSYALGVTLAGVQGFRYRGAWTASTPGRLMVLHPDEVHDGEAGTAGGFRYRMVYLAPHRVAAALGARARGLPFVRVPVSGDPRLALAVGAAVADLDHPLEPLARDQVVMTLAEALLALDPSAARGGRTAPTCPRAVEQARAFLEAHCTRRVDATDLEAVTGLDRYTLARQFRARLGTSPYRYLTLRRLDRARAALWRGAPLADAACGAGFADQSHMTRQFTRTYGLPPGRWRALAGGAGAADLSRPGRGRRSTTE